MAKPVSEFTGTIRAWAERCKARAEQPEFQANAKRLDDETEAERARGIETMQRQQLAEAGVPLGLVLSGALKAPNETDAMREVRAFLSRPEQLFLGLTGPKGRGKTFALAWAVRERGGRFVEAQSLVLAGIFDRPLWDDLATTPLLALDELGTEHRNDAFEAALYNLLNKRFQDARKTVYATNLDARQFRTRYGAAGMDRLIERVTSAGAFVSLPGETMRKPFVPTRVPFPDDEEDERDD